MLIDAPRSPIAAPQRVPPSSNSRFAAVSYCLFSDAPRLTAIGCRDKNLSIFEGRHGTDPNVAVRIGAVPYTVQEHECRGMIAPGRDCVYGTGVHAHMRAAIAPKKLMERLRGCSYVMAAGSKC